jgi:hypothetical protein
MRGGNSFPPREILLLSHIGSMKDFFNPDSGSKFGEIPRAFRCGSKV